MTEWACSGAQPGPSLGEEETGAGEEGLVGSPGFALWGVLWSQAMTSEGAGFKFPTLPLNRLVALGT